MKKLYAAFALLCTGFVSQAQINKGTILLGGDLSVNTTSTSTSGVPSNTSKYSSWEISPSVGLAVATNLIVGLHLGLGGASATGGSTKENDYTLGAFLRKYKYLGSKFYFFAETSLDFMHSDQTNNNNPVAGYLQDVRNSYVTLDFNPGVAYSLSRHWQLEVEFPDLVQASYNRQQTIDTPPPPNGGLQSKTTSNSFGFSTNLSTGFDVQVGLRYLIGG
jgi:hypothetical protein